MYEQLQRDAASTWARWANAVADGGDPPKPIELLEVGALLAISQPAAALEKDAQAIREVRELEQRAASCRERAAAQRTPHGSRDERRERIAALRAELRRLESVSVVHPLQMQAGELLGAAGRIRRKHPLAFQAVEPAKPAKAAKPKRRAKQEAAA